MTASRASMDPIALWRNAPSERSAAFSAVFGDIAQAMQQFLRARLSALYFQETAEPFSVPRRALSMLAYQASAPSSRTHGREFTYDVINPRMMAGFWWSAAKEFPAALAQWEAKFTESNELELAGFYATRHHRRLLGLVREHKGLIDRLLSSETSMLNDLINFAIAVRHARRPLAAHIRLMRSWEFTLRRIFPGIDASGLAAELFRLVSLTLEAALPPNGDIPVAAEPQIAAALPANVIVMPLAA